MKQIFFPLLLLITSCFSCTDDRDIPSDAILKDPASVVIHYWNFNSVSGTLESVDPDFSATSGAAISYEGTGAGVLDEFHPGYDTNARNGDIAGSGIRARNPSDTRDLILKLPTTGFKKIILQFATARTGSGAATQTYSYSIDGGMSYTANGLSLNTFNPVEDPDNSLATLDFTAIAAADDNANFQVKIEFSGDTAAGATGNNRFDNVTLEGVSLGGIIPPDPTLHLFQYWNFNSLAGTIDSIPPDATLISGNTAAITYPGTGTGYMDDFNPGSQLNAQGSDLPGSGLRARNPSDTRSLLISAPTTGYQNVIVKFATARSSATGASVQNYSYTVDGTNFVTTDLPVTTFTPGIDPAYDIVTLDFTAIPGADNNPLFAVKISFAGDEATGTTGNTRFDNITFQGNSL